MSGLTWGDLAGATDVDPEAAASHLEFLFDPGDIVHISAFRNKKPSKKHVSVLTIGGERDDQCESLRTEGLDWLSRGEADNPWNVYYSIAPATEVVDGMSKRPSAKHSAGIRQLFCDLDCKPGSFENGEEVRKYIESLPVTPSCIVWTGSGGAHCSWVIDRDSREAFEADTKVAEKWWTMLVGYAPEGVSIDRLIDSDSRVLRLPGTVRWPKGGALEKSAPVVGEYYDVPGLTHEKFVELTEEWFKGYNERIEKRRSEDDALSAQMVDISQRKGMWSDLIILSMIDELAEEYLDWAEILEGAGWSYFREGGDGSEEWTRPGGAGKSATVNWPESPESPMSLFSDDVSTGLADLKEAGIHLTKWRVFLRLSHGDDVWAALDDLGMRGSKVE